MNSSAASSTVVTVKPVVDLNDPTADGTKIQIQSAMLSSDGRSMNIVVSPVPERLQKAAR